MKKWKEKKRKEEKRKEVVSMAAKVLVLENPGIAPGIE